MVLPEPACFSRSCTHYRGAKQIAGIIVNVCLAFPHGIPDVITSGENLHDNPFPGDHGILYERGEMDVSGFSNIEQERAALVEGSA